MIRFIFFIIITNIPFDSNLKKGIKKYKNGKYEKAIHILKTKNKKKNYDHYFYLGHSYSFIGKNEFSILYYDSAISLNNKYDIAFFERGVSYFLSGNSRKALEDINRAIIINSNNANYFINRGSIYYDLGMVESACEDWRKAIRMDNDIVDSTIIQMNCN
tara:strand:- start:692 stop:1171 length:480 start_codon:yes stop_codon:yes gene_type:complete